MNKSNNRQLVKTSNNVIFEGGNEIDKSGYPDGEWMVEPDRFNWMSSSFPCCVIRNPTFGHLCGYVGISQDHPLHDLSYQNEKVYKSDISIHGGLTFSESEIHKDTEDREKCLWWFGFDCAHSCDYSPAPEIAAFSNGTYRNFEWTIKECESLAKQLKWCE